MFSVFIENDRVENCVGRGPTKNLFCLPSIGFPTFSEKRNSEMLRYVKIEYRKTKCFLACLELSLHRNVDNTTNGEQMESSENVLKT